MITVNFGTAALATALPSLHRLWQSRRVRTSYDHEAGDVLQENEGNI